MTRKEALKILDVFKREIIIDTEALPYTFSNGTKRIYVKGRIEEIKDIVSMQVSEEERLLIKEWLEGNNNDERKDN